MPSSLANHFGYDIEFDAAGRYGQYLIDFPALAEHLAQLHLAATQRGVTLDKVIIDARYLAQLYATPRGHYLKTRLNFMREKPWVRHDEHYHVDFGLLCKRKD